MRVLRPVLLRAAPITNQICTKEGVMYIYVFVYVILSIVSLYGIYFNSDKTVFILLTYFSFMSLSVVGFFNEMVDGSGDNRMKKLSPEYLESKIITKFQILIIHFLLCMSLLFIRVLEYHSGIVDLGIFYNLAIYGVLPFGMLCFSIIIWRIM